MLGGPGSGKSTLTRYLASTIARREGGPAPLLLTVRDWIAEGKREGLLDMVARQATTLLSVRTDREALEALCDGGRVLLLVDGLDEVADAAGRRDLRNRLHAFITRFPRVPVLVTSRLAGYHEVPLDHEQEFDELRLERFDDEALEQFVHRWYDLVESDPGERLRKRVNLLRALEVEPRAKELARNPLMATLIGMVHFFHAQLPGDRAKLYGMVIELLLVSWPAEHGRELAELHGTVQQPMLEALALRLQERRATEETHPDWQKVEVLVEVATLEELLAELLAERFPERGAGELRHLARKWGKWLVDGSGLLQEQRPGRVGFLHLSLMEYMAGRALFEQHSSLGHAAVARVVAERRDRAVWRETLLLMLGGESRKRDLGRQVVEQLLEREGVVPQWSACTFGLALLREEVDIGEQRECLLEGACRAAIEVWPFQWKDAFQPLFDVVRFGRTHGQATRTWLLDALASVCGEPLIGVVAMACEALPWELVEPRLAARIDAPMVAQTLLELGHAHPAGAWARAHATTEVWASWARTTPLVGVQSRSFESLAGSGRCGAWIPRSMARAGWVAATTEQAAARLRTKTREDGRRGLPSAITWTTPHAKQVEARLDFSLFDPRLGEGSFAGGPDDFSRDFARHFTRSHAREFARELSRHHSSGFPQPFARDFARELARHFALDFALDFSHYYDLDIALDFAPDFARYLARHFAQNFERNLLHDFAHDAPLDFLHDFASTISVAETPCAAPYTAASSWEGLRRAQDRDSANDFAAALFAAMVGDAHAGLLTIPGLVHPHDASILAAIRIQNRWLGLFFTSLVDHATRSRSLPEHPELHALLLTYGLVQYQTTWAWPDCPYWRSWLADGPPAHWLPAHVWHLVRSIQEPADSGHCERAMTALDRNDWPELAQALRETTLVPTPPEVLALFDHGDTPDPAPPSA